jgi:hypothetical protein
MILYIEEVLTVLRLKHDNVAVVPEEKEQLAASIAAMQANLDKLKPVIDAHNRDYHEMLERDTEMERLIHEFKNSLLIEKIKMDTWENKKKSTNK